MIWETYTAGKYIGDGVLFHNGGYPCQSPVVLRVRVWRHHNFNPLDITSLNLLIVRLNRTK
jgi:hypothetical protein